MLFRSITEIIVYDLPDGMAREEVVANKIARYWGRWPNLPGVSLGSNIAFVNDAQRHPTANVQGAQCAMCCFGWRPADWTVCSRSPRTRGSATDHGTLPTISTGRYQSVTVIVTKKDWRGSISHRGVCCCSISFPKQCRCCASRPIWLYSTMAKDRRSAVGDDKITLAARHVAQEHIIIARQMRLITRLRDKGRSTKDEERTLDLFERTLKIFEDHLAQLLFEQQAPPPPQLVRQQPYVSNLL